VLNLGAVSYGLAAVAFLALAALLIVAWEGRGQGARLIIATVATAIWSVVLALFSTDDAAPALPVFVAGTLRHAAWLIVLAGLVRTAGFPRVLARLAYAAWLGVLALGIGAAILRAQWFLTVMITAGVLLPLIGLVLLEQIYRNANASGRWILRYLYIGLAGMFVYDIFLYSQALLLGGIVQDVWYARGFVFALTVPFLALAARRNPDWSIKVFVSRDIAFYSTSFLAVGGYLLVMAAGGYIVQLLGGSWGYMAQIVFFAGALGLLAALVGSTTLRRKLKVFLVKHFYRNKYEYREEWLRFISTLSEERADEDARVTGLRAVAQIIASPGAALLALEERRDGCSIAASWPSDGLIPESAVEMCGNKQLLDLLGRREWVVDLAEYREDRDAYEQLDLPAWLVSRKEWRLLVPVLLRDRLLGIMLLKSPPSDFELTFEDRDLLKTVARHVATHLAQFDSERRLAESRQFEAYSRLSAFLMHDLKNSVAQLNLVVANAGRHKSNPAFIDDAIETVAGTASRMTRLIEQLQRGEVSESRERVALESIARIAVERSQGREPKPELLVEQAGLEVTANAERLVSVLEHVIRNAQDATPGHGRVTVTVATRDRAAAVMVTDTGQGMSAEFVRERLFRPFDSTKGARGMGIGAYQTREYARSLGGAVEVESTSGRGTVFSLILPIAEPPAGT
jgi:putative PEP-CTERM system histidine kinase